MMRGLDTPVKEVRGKVFKEVAKVAFESTPDDLIDDIED